MQAKIFGWLILFGVAIGLRKLRVGLEIGYRASDHLSKGVPVGVVASWALLGILAIWAIWESRRMLGG